MIVRFISLTRDHNLSTGLMLNIHKHAKNTPRVLTSSYAVSITSGYNHLVKQVTELSKFPADEEILCFIHEDARLHFDFDTVIPKYFQGLRNPGVMGFVGCGRIAYDSRFWLGAPLVGSLIQGGFPPEDPPNLCFDEPRQVSGTVDPAFGAQYRWEEVDSVDGYCMFIKRSVFEKIGGFDERFDAWHCYDADLCMSALKAGYQNYVIGQKSQHFSGGSLADPWARENAKWIQKWLPWLKQRR
jgi:hypothetical protein